MALPFLIIQITGPAAAQPRAPVYIKPGLPPVVYAQSYSSPYALTTVEQPPFTQDNWSAPQRPYIVRAEARSSFIPLLQSIQPPIAQSDWPLPIRPYIVRSVNYGMATTLLTPAEVVQPPFHQDDWPLPKRPPIVYAMASGAFIPLLHSIMPPIAQRDWPVPVQPWRVVTQPQTRPLPLLVPVAPTDKPPTPVNWPVPTAPTFQASQIHTNLALGHIPPPEPEPEKPFHLDAWPVPTQPPRVYAHSPGRPLTTRPPTDPTKQPPAYSYPLPPILPYRQYAQSYSTPTPLLTFVQPKPFLQRDWPLPKRPGIVRAEAISANEMLLRSIKPPNRQSLWPLPPQRAVPQLTSGFVRGMVRVPPVVVVHERVQAYIIG